MPRLETTITFTCVEEIRRMHPLIIKRFKVHSPCVEAELAAYETPAGEKRAVFEKKGFTNAGVCRGYWNEAEKMESLILEEGFRYALSKLNADDVMKVTYWEEY